MTSTSMSMHVSEASMSSRRNRFEDRSLLHFPVISFKPLARSFNVPKKLRGVSLDLAPGLVDRGAFEVRVETTSKNCITLIRLIASGAAHQFMFCFTDGDDEPVRTKRGLFSKRQPQSRSYVRAPGFVKNGENLKPDELTPRPVNLTVRLLGQPTYYFAK